MNRLRQNFHLHTTTSLPDTLKNTRCFAQNSQCQVVAELREVRPFWGQATLGQDSTGMGDLLHKFWCCFIFPLFLDSQMQLVKFFVGRRFVNSALCRQALEVRLFGFMTAKRDISALWRLRGAWGASPPVRLLRT